MKHAKRICTVLAMMLCAALALVGCRDQTPPLPDEMTETDVRSQEDTKRETEGQTDPVTTPETDLDTAPETDPEPETEPAPQCLEYRLRSDGAYAVVGIGTWIDAELVIPSEYNGAPVVEVEREAFQTATHLTSITIPASVTEVYDIEFPVSIEQNNRIRSAAHLFRKLTGLLIADIAGW